MIIHVAAVSSNSDSFLLALTAIHIDLRGTRGPLYLFSTSLNAYQFLSEKKKITHKHLVKSQS